MDTRPLDSKLDWQFFDAERPSRADAALIRPLTESAARAVWTRLISANPRQRHPMLLSADHWLQPVRCVAPSWEEVWRAKRTDPDPMTTFLSDRLGWSPGTPVLFFWMRERVVCVPWGVFLRTWRLFLFDDEAPFLLSEQAPQVVTFYPGGGVGLCERPQ